MGSAKVISGGSLTAAQTSKISNTPADTNAELSAKKSTLTSVDLSGGTVINVGESARDTFAANRAITFAGVTVQGSELRLLATVSVASVDLTIPSSNRIGQDGAFTTITLTQGTHELSWLYTSGSWLLADSAKGTFDAASVTLVDAGGWFGTDNVEAALQQLAAAVDALQSGAPTLSSADVDGTTLTLVFNKAVNVGVGGSGGFDVDGATAGDNLAATYSSGSGSNTLIFTLSAAANAGDTLNLDYVQPGDGIEDTSGNDLESFTDAAVTNSTGGDVTAPTLNTATIESDGLTLTLAFDENVDEGVGGPDGFDLDGAASGDNLLTVGSPTGGGSTTLTYTLEDPVMLGETVTLDYVQPGNGIEDTAGNDLASIVDMAVTNNSTLVPVLTSADVDGTAVTLVFNVPIFDGGAGTGTFDMDGLTAGDNIAMSYSSGLGSNTLLYTLNNAAEAGDTLNLDFVQPTNGLEDQSGNELASFTDQAVTNNTSGGLLMDEKFNGAGFGGSWSGSTGDWDDNYSGTGAPLEGSSSLFGQVGDGAIQYDLGSEQGEVWIQFRIRCNTTGADDPLIRAYNANGTAFGDCVWHLEAQAGGFQRLRIQQGLTVEAGTKVDTASSSFLPDTTYYVTIHYVPESTDTALDGEVHLWLNTGGYDHSGPADASATDGGREDGMKVLEIRAPDTDIIYDDIMVGTSEPA